MSDQPEACRIMDDEGLFDLEQLESIVRHMRALREPD